MYSRKELTDMYRALLDNHKRRLDLEEIRLQAETKEIKRKAIISRLVDSQGKFPWEEGYE